MNYEEMTVADAKKLLPSVENIYHFYAKLRSGLQKQGFPPTDAFYQRVVDAENSAHTIMIWTFYATVKNGVGVAERKEV